MTLYLQEVLRYSPLVTGLAFGVLGAGTVTGGLLGARVIARLGTYRVLVGAFVLQAAATASLVALGDAHDWIALFLVASFVGGVGNMQAIVAFMVTATSGLPDDEQGLATGLATMTQQVGITIGIPIMSAIVAARTSALGGRTPRRSSAEYGSPCSSTPPSSSPVPCSRGCSCAAAPSPDRKDDHGSATDRKGLHRHRCLGRNR